TPRCMREATILTVPGLWSSGPEHWQSFWEREALACRRVEQTDWKTPLCADWVATIDAAVAAAPGPAVPVPPSPRRLAVAHWAGAARPIRGALLVAPVDLEAGTRPKGPRGFVPMPLRPLPFPSVVVASADDPYVSLHRARVFASAWGSAFVDVGPRGHINAA